MNASSGRFAATGRGRESTSGAIRVMRTNGCMVARRSRMAYHHRILRKHTAFFQKCSAKRSKGTSFSVTGFENNAVT